MFYAATDRVNRYPAALAAVEATQAAEIVFTLVFEALLLGIQPPDLWGCLGLACIALGMLRHATPKQSA
jgi:hypothetical protein